MKTRYKYIHFVQKSVIWYCLNNKTDDILGVISHFREWRKWIFEAGRGTIYSADCLLDIADFIGQLNDKK